MLTQHGKRSVEVLLHLQAEQTSIYLPYLDLSWEQKVRNDKMQL